jgi:hypothetical protein
MPHVRSKKPKATSEKASPGPQLSSFQRQALHPSKPSNRYSASAIRSLIPNSETEA